MGDSLVWGLSANAQFKREQVLIAQDPTATSDAYRTYDANIRIGSADRKWQVALIGKNLTDEYVFRGGGNVPGTGGNTGTAEGYPSDLQGVAIRPRQVELEFTYNF
ncbi:MAG: ligand-gated channel, partial [Proteobacteria bacterium]|nr:ligand-gated channel [Pseudomonadota bacterium]